MVPERGYNFTYVRTLFIDDSARRAPCRDLRRGGGTAECRYNGHPHVQTPVLDEMARTGLRLDRFYAGSAVCSPTRASVMTGRHANRSGVLAFNFSTRPEEITLPQILQQAGYRTGHFGKWHIGAVKRESPVSPNRMGFDESLSHDNYFDMDPALSRNGAAPVVFKGESSEVLVDEAPRVLRVGWCTVVGFADGSAHRIAGSHGAPETQAATTPWMPLSHATALDATEEWVPQLWRDMDTTLAAAPLGEPTTALVLGRPGGPHFRPSEVARLGYLAGIIASLLR